MAFFPTSTALPSYCLWSLTALLLALTSVPRSSAITTLESNGANSTQIFCAANANTTFGTVFTNTSHYGALTCPNYFVDVSNITNGYSGFSLGMTGAQGLAYHVSTHVDFRLVVNTLDIPAAGGSIIAVLASGPNLGLASITAALKAGTITSIAEPSTSTLVVLSVTFPAASSSNATLDSNGNRIPAWTNTRTTQPNASAIDSVFFYQPPSANSTIGGFYTWSINPTYNSFFNASQWSTDPLGAIYMTTAVANNITITLASTEADSIFYLDFPSPPPAPPPSPSPPSAAMRALPGVTAQLLIAVLVAVMCF